MPPLFDENQQLDESGLIDSFVNKAPSNHKDMLISQGFNPETGDLETFVEEHCKWAETTDNIAGSKFSVSDKDNNTKRKKKRSKFKERDENGKKRHKKQYWLYFSLHGEKKATPPESTNSSNQGPTASLIIEQRITRIIPEK